MRCVQQKRAPRDHWRSAFSWWSARRLTCFLRPHRDASLVHTFARKAFAFALRSCCCCGVSDFLLSNRAVDWVSASGGERVATITSIISCLFRNIHSCVCVCMFWIFIILLCIIVGWLLGWWIVRSFDRWTRSFTRSSVGQCCFLFFFFAIWFVITFALVFLRCYSLR